VHDLICFLLEFARLWDSIVKVHDRPTTMATSFISPIWSTRIILCITYLTPTPSYFLQSYDFWTFVLGCVLELGVNSVLLLHLEFQLLLQLTAVHTEGRMCTGPCNVPVFSLGTDMLDLDVAGFVFILVSTQFLKKIFRSTEFYVSTLYHDHTCMHST